MARPLVEVKIGDIKLNAILDTGSWRSYIRKEVGKDFPIVPTERFQVKIGGEKLTIKEARLVSGVVKDSDGRAYTFGEKLFPIPELGKENGKRIDILFGSVLLEDWGAVIDDSTRPPKVDYRRLREGELTEL